MMVVSPSHRFGPGVPIQDAPNVITYPEPNASVIKAAEGTYTLVDTLYLPTPQKIATDPQSILEANPITTEYVPLTAGTRLRLVRIKPDRKDDRESSRSSFSTHNSKSGNMFHPFVSMLSEDPKNSVANTNTITRTATHTGSRDVSTSSTTMMTNEEVPQTPVTETAGNNLTLPTSGSRFFGRNAAAQGGSGGDGAGGSGSNLGFGGVGSRDRDWSKRKAKNIVSSTSAFFSRVTTADNLSKRLSERAADGFFGFVNVGRSVQWLDISSSNKAEPLTKIVFSSAHCLCHDINQNTATMSHVDIVLGFNTGDILWYNPMAQQYVRFNKNGCMTPSPVITIQWVPDSERLFVAGFGNGLLLLFDRERDDSTTFLAPRETDIYEGRLFKEIMEQEEAKRVAEGIPSLEERLTLLSLQNQVNPAWGHNLSRREIYAIAFSPNNEHMVVTSDDGFVYYFDLTKIDFPKYIPDAYVPFCSGIHSIAWSPDSQFFITGGQDDMVYVWSASDRQPLARCTGHRGWVVNVAFDPWRCDSQAYRFGSVGEDGRLCLWDFNISMVHPPRMSHAESERSETQTYQTSTVTAHPRPTRSATNIPAIVSQKLEDHALEGLVFTEDFLITTSYSGYIRTWKRPAIAPVDGLQRAP